MRQGLGTQLRHLIDLLDGAVNQAYEDADLHYRSRYTPIMRVLLPGEPVTVGQIAQAAGITQPSATQTVGLMLKAGLVTSQTASGDGRQRLIQLTKQGQALVPKLKLCWQATEAAATSLEADMSLPLQEVLASAIRSLDQRSFGARISEARSAMSSQAGRGGSKTRVRSKKREG